MCHIDGDYAILMLSLVCRRWKILVADSVFRERVHFRWLSGVYDWRKASREFKEKYFVMYNILECFMCREKYKCVPGFRQRGSRGALRFYSESGDDDHPGYCSPYCASAAGAFDDDW